MDYKEQIEGFPEEVVNKMLYYQEAQGYKRDISVFEKNKCSGDISKGFEWDMTPEGHDFWHDIIINKKFNLFFGKYPKQEIFPEKWCVENCEEVGEWLNTVTKTSVYTELKILIGWGYLCFPSIQCYNTNTHLYNFIPKDYTLITLEQWRNHYKKQDKMEKEIVGYKLRNEFEEYRKFALKISQAIENWENSQRKYDIHIDQKSYIRRLENAGVLDIWFEPVYKEKKKFPKINGYDGVYIKQYNNVKYGCVGFNIGALYSLLNNINISDSRKIKSIKLSSGVEITIDQIEQIVDYIKDQQETL